MNTSRQPCHPKRSFKPIVLALALALPGSAALGAAIGDTVKTRADQNIDQQYGRDSVYGFSPDSKPLSPDRTSGPHWFHKTGQKEAALNESQRAELGSGYTDSEMMSSGVMSRDEATSNAGSGYTDSEMMSQAGSGYTGGEAIVSQADTAEGAFLQSSSEVALAGEAQGDWEGKYAVIIPVAAEDGTTNEFDRGYYKDPDRTPILVIVSDNSSMEGNQSASVVEQGWSTAAD
jgi:hypothetical protein